MNPAMNQTTDTLNETKEGAKTVFIKLFCKSQFPQKSVNVLFILVMRKDKLTDS